MNASCAVSRISRARASLSASCAQRLAPLVVGQRDDDQVGDRDARSSARRPSRRAAPPTCSAQSTPTDVVVRAAAARRASRRCRAAEDRSSRNSRVRGSVCASCAAMTRSRSMASKYAGASLREQRRAGFVRRRSRRYRPTQRSPASSSNRHMLRRSTCSAPAAISQDAAQPIVEALAGIGVARRQRRERLALRREPPLAGLQRRFGRSCSLMSWNTVSTAGSPSHVISRADASTHSASARRPLDADPVVCTSVTLQPRGELEPFVGVHVSTR